MAVIAAAETCRDIEMDPPDPPWLLLPPLNCERSRAMLLIAHGRARGAVQRRPPPSTTVPAAGAAGAAGATGAAGAAAGAGVTTT